MRNHANKGRAAEMLIEMANRYYLQQGIAVVTKVPTEWLPLRGYDGRIVSAKVSRRSIVDFIGVWAGRAIAFDVKECSGPYWRLAELQEHQRRFLGDWDRAGGVSFVLLRNNVTERVHLLWMYQYEKRRLRAESSGRQRTIKLSEIDDLPLCPSVPGCPCDYLAALRS